MSLCLVSGGLLAALPLTAFTLAWTHSIEKTRWEEDWHIVGTRLEVREARIRGSGAGMAPPAGARYENGGWHYRPALAALTTLRLTHSPHTPGYMLCTGEGCRPLADLLPRIGENAVIEISACADRQPDS